MRIARVADDRVRLAWAEAYAAGAGSPGCVAAALGDIVTADGDEDTARRLGYRVGVLQSAPMAIPMYERLGFACCCANPQFRWSPQITGQESAAPLPNYSLNSEPWEATRFEPAHIPGLQRHYTG